MNEQSSAMTIPTLRGVDQLEIISLQDNIVELHAAVDREEVQTVLQWVKSEEGICINAEIMKLDLSLIEAIVVSHGHPDHSGRLLKVLEKLNRACPEPCPEQGRRDSRREELSILVHEDMFKPRGMERMERCPRCPLSLVKTS